jgi:hypothetical protein
MGYRFGEHRYGEGLYSRWPDWWHDKGVPGRCVDDASCAPPTWAPVAPPANAWAPVGGPAPVWAPSVPGGPPWAPTARRKPVPGQFP